MLRRASHDLKTPEPDAGDIQTLLDLIEGPGSPWCWWAAGSSAPRGAVPQFRTFIERLNAPVASTIMGGGACPGNHRLFTGMIGMHGSHASNLASDQCDLLIAVGCRFSDRVATDPATFAPNAKIVHIDIDRAEIDKNVLTHHHIIGDARRVLELLNEKLPSTTTRSGRRGCSPTRRCPSRKTMFSTPTRFWRPSRPSPAGTPS